MRCFNTDTNNTIDIIRDKKHFMKVWKHKMNLYIYLKGKPTKQKNTKQPNRHGLPFPGMSLRGHNFCFQQNNFDFKT